MNTLTTQFTLAALATSVTATNLMSREWYTMGGGGFLDDLMSTTNTKTVIRRTCTWKNGVKECTDGGTSTE